MRNVELDEAGKLAAFRERFGRGYDATAQAVEGAVEGEKAVEEVAAKPVEEDAGLNFEDLLSEYTPQDTSAMKDSGPKRSPTRRK